MLSGMELKIKRIVKGINAVEVAEYLGISKGYVSLMEHDKRNISKNMYEKWTEFLGINKL